MRYDMVFTAVRNFAFRIAILFFFLTFIVLYHQGCSNARFGSANKKSVLPATVHDFDIDLGGDDHQGVDHPEEEPESLPGCESVEGKNHVLNHSFEIEDRRRGLVHDLEINSLAGKDDGNWDVYETLPGEGNVESAWYVEAGYAGIKVRAGVESVKAKTGRLLVELDSYPDTGNGDNTNTKFSQDIVLAAGDYLLSFYYRPRRPQLNDSGLIVLVNDAEISSHDSDDTSEWQKITLLIKDLQAGQNKLSFQAGGTANSYGALLDEIQLRTCIPAEL